jgi:hypothetical protein
MQLMLFSQYEATRDTLQKSVDENRGNEESLKELEAAHRHNWGVFSKTPQYKAIFEVPNAWNTPSRG